MEKDPMTQFKEWFDEATATEKAVEVNAMAVGTCGKDMMPSVRYVLLKEVSQGGFVFFTNYESKKANQIIENPKVCCMFYWPTCNRSVRVEGVAHKIDPEESDAYFNSRALESRIASSVSTQSKKLTEEQKQDMIEKIEQQVQKATSGEIEVKRPNTWGGYRIIPESVEFWQGKRARFHDRFLYEKQENGEWIISILSP